MIQYCHKATIYTGLPHCRCRHASPARKPSIHGIRLIVGILLASIMILSSAHAQFAGGNGTPAAPYQVVTAEQLDRIRDHLDACFVQTADIDLGEAPWNSGTGWVPIGRDEAGHYFSGSYNGGGHTISNLTINRPAGDHQGLFGLVHGGSLSNLVLAGVVINAGNRVGALAGQLEHGASATHCAMSGTVAGNSRAGGLIGSVQNGSRIEHCTSDAVVTGVDQRIGGLAGQLWTDSAIIASHAIGTVHGGSLVGGLVGNNSVNSLIRQSHAIGTVVGDGTVGGLAGQNWASQVIESFADCSLTNFGLYTGGLIGRMNTSTDEVYHAWSRGSARGTRYAGGLVGHLNGGLIADSYSHCSVDGGFVDYANRGGLVGSAGDGTRITRSYSTGRMSGAHSGVGGLVGSRHSTSLVVDSYWDTQTSGRSTSAGGAGRSTEQMQQRETYIGYNFRTLWQIDEDNDYPVFQDLSVHAQPIALTTADLDGDGTPEQPFLVATLDELNAMRQGLTNHYRLTADIDAAATVSWDMGRGWEPIGWLEQRFMGGFDGAGHVISNLVINRPAVGYQGLFGLLQDAEVRNLRLAELNVYSAPEKGGDYVGLLAGASVRGSIENVHADGEASGGSRIGGLVGLLNSGARVALVSSTVSVRGGLLTGGLIGRMNTSTDEVYHAWSRGSARGTRYAGGLVGHLNGGLIADSYSHCSVDGGFVDYANRGGLVGSAGDGARITRSYSTGRMSGAYSGVGGLVGSRHSTSLVVDSYWDTHTSGQTVSAGGAGRSTEQMTFPHDAVTTYTGWDFLDTWSRDFDDRNDGYPRLLAHGEYNVIYEVGTGGSLTGPALQNVMAGGSAQAVEALPDDGALFAAWCDGLADASRTDHGITNSLLRTAAFRSGGGVPINWYVDHGIERGENETWSDLDDRDPHDKGVTLLEEYLADTNPNDPHSRLQFMQSVRTPQGMRLHWRGGERARQIVYWTQDLTFNPVAWHPLLTNEPPTTILVATNIPWFQNVDTVYFRLSADRQPE